MLKQPRQLNRAGFTIVELLIVVVVIAILAAITIVSYRGISQRAITSTLQSELSTTARKLETDKVTSGSTDYHEDVASTGIPQREGATRTYYRSGQTFCIAYAQGNIFQYITNSGSPKAGTCADAGFSDTTIFTYNTTLGTCTTTVQLPITLPTSAPGSTINWGDGSTEALSSAVQSHTYASEGTYTVTYDGPINTMNNYSVTGANRGCLASVDRWKSGITPTAINLRLSGVSSVAEPPSSVTDMSYMFGGVIAFNQDISSWDVSNVTNMNHMFSLAQAFNQPIGAWNTSNVTDMSYMFQSANAFNQPIGGWNTGKVTAMNYMFSGAREFDKPIGGWNVSNVTNMSLMFDGARIFNQPLNSWNVSKVTDMSFMFRYTSLFNQPLNNWDTSKVTTMSNMFYEYSSPVAVFNQNLSSWNVSSVITKPPANFSTNNPNWTLPKPGTGW